MAILSTATKSRMLVTALFLFVFVSSCVQSDQNSLSATVGPITFSPPPGIYSLDQKVTLTTTIKDGHLYFTTDGSDPKVDPGHLYSQPIAVAGDGTSMEIRAIVDDPAGTDTSIGAGIFKITYKKKSAASSSKSSASKSSSGDSSDTTTTSTSSDTTTTKSTTTAKSTTTGTAAATGTTGSTTMASASAVTMLPAGGSFATDQSVTLSSTSAGALIYYTTDGSTPTVNSTLYTGSISVVGGGSGAVTTVIKAIATSSSLTSSEVSSQTYIVQWVPVVTAPTLSRSGNSVTITSTTAGASLSYTADGTDPSTSNTAISAPSPVVVDVTAAMAAGSQIYVRAISTKAASQNSTEALYGKVAQPSLSPTPNGFASTQTVSITSATSGATIYYTTNGVNPVVGSSFTSTYSSALSVSASTQIKAIAVKATFENSAMTTGDFHIGTMVYVASNGVDSTSSSGGNAAGSALNPYQSLAYALTQIGTAAAVIHVKEGTYQLASAGLSITSTAVKAIYGGYKASDWTVRDPDLYPSILSATTNDITKMIYLTTGNHIIDGFTLIGPDNYNNALQIGIDIGSGAPIIRNNKIRMAITVGSSPAPNDTLIAVRTSGSSGVKPQIINNDISTGDDYNGTRYFYGILILSGDPLIFNNVINTSGVAVNGNWSIAYNGGSPKIINNTIFFGYAASALMSFGIGAYWQSTATVTPTIENNLVYGIGSGTYGACVYAYQSSNVPSSLANNLLFNCPEGLYVNDNGAGGNSVYTTTAGLNVVSGMADNFTKPSALSYATYSSLLFTNPPDTTTARYGWASPNTVPSVAISDINFRLKGTVDADLDQVRTDGKDQSTSTYPQLFGDRDGVIRTTGWSVGAFEKD